jgi:hypothetical protein
MHLKKISFIFKEKKKELLANGYKNSRWPIVTVKCRNGCQVNK